MNLRALVGHNKITRILLSAILLSVLPSTIGPLPSAVAAPASTLNSISNEAKCATSVSDTSSAKLDVILDGNYCVLRFLSSTNTWTPPSSIDRIEYLVIGGGGGGAGGRGGGGGAGGFLAGTISTPTSLSITVANGGAGGVNNSSGSNGETSTISYSNTSISAIGGGGGGTSFGNASTFPARSGASGGGAGVYISFTGSNTEIGTPGGLGIAGQGNNGGSSGGTNPNTGSDSSFSFKGSCSQNWDQIRNTAGGGGAGGKGISGRGGSAPLMSPTDLTGCTPTVAPDGGAGATSKITGSVQFYAAGGGGSAGRFDKQSENVNYYTAPPGAGGSGIGGAGSPIAGTNGGAGMANTGSGGGGGGVSRTTDSDKGACATPTDPDESCNGGAGGSGVVIIKFMVAPYTGDATECLNGVSDTRSAVFSYTTVGGDCVLTFTTVDTQTTGTNTWTFPRGIGDVRILIVGAGGGGGNNAGGGGGGGQVFETQTSQFKFGVSYSFTIGKGGTRKGSISAGNPTGGFNGESSAIAGEGISLSALGGGGAAGRFDSSDSQTSLTAWTSGGEGVQATSSTSINLTRYPVGGANAVGGRGGYVNFGSNYGGGGGGGGAGGPGGAASVVSFSSHIGGSGGMGAYSNITGTRLCFGGGGAGGSLNSSSSETTTAKAVAGCGGADGTRASIAAQSDAPADQGGGGGGASESINARGGMGGTGVIIIRYSLPSPSGLSRDWNLACRNFSNGTTTVNDSIASGVFGSRFMTDSTTSDFSFPSINETSTNATQNWGNSSPAGCGDGTNFTLYLSGYLRSPSLTSSTDFYFLLVTDMGVTMKFGGVGVMLNTLITEGVSTNVCNTDGGGTPSGSYNCGSRATPRSTSRLTMPANSWQFVEIWLHERDPASKSSFPNALRASLELQYQLEGGSSTSVPREWLSRNVPRSVTTSLTSDTQTAASSLVANVDTSTRVIGGVNDSVTAMSMGGKFSFYEGGSAITGCQNLNSTNGTAQCSLGTLPRDSVKRNYRVAFTPDTSTASSDLQYNVFATSSWEGVIQLGKLKNATLRIGQYNAFVGMSTYPLNVYADSTIYGAITRSVTDSGTASCALDVGRYFLTAQRVGSCTVSVNAAGDASYDPETATATIYWIQWSDAYATRVASTPNEIVLNHQTAITKYNYDTLTVTGYQNGSGSAVTSITAGSQLRILGDGFNTADSSTQAAFGNAEIVDMNFSSPALQILSNGSGGFYILVTVPSGATTDNVVISSAKGIAVGPVLTILTP